MTRLAPLVAALLLLAAPAVIRGVAAEPSRAQPPPAFRAGAATRAAGGPSPAAGGPVTGSPVDGTAIPTRRWAWPLVPRPVVLRPFQPPAQRWLAGHRGVDLAADEGVVVVSPAEGVVAFVGVVAGVPVLSVEHAGGLRSTYEPVTPLLTVGTPVARGQPIARLAGGGLAHCEPRSCLHWGVRRGEDYLDPTSLVTGGPPVLLPLH